MNFAWIHLEAKETSVWLDGETDCDFIVIT